MSSAIPLQSSGSKMCRSCNNKRTRTTPVGLDACQRCAFEAEIEYQVLKDAQAEMAGGE